MTSEKVKTAIAAIKAGDKVSGRKLLSEVVKEDPSNEKAWLWLSACVNDVKQKRYCLKKALSLNPANQTARRALAQLESTDEPPVDAITTQSTKVASSSLPRIQDSILNSESTSLKKHNQIPTKWLILGTFGGVLALAVIIIGIINITASLNPTTVPAVSTELTITQTPTTTEEDPSTVPPTSTPKAAVSCQTLAQSYYDEINPQVLEFIDTARVANSTPRVALGSVIQDMQRIKRNIENIITPSCVQAASSLIVNGMDSVISGLIDFMGNVSETLVQQKLNQGYLDMLNGSEQLIALASGQPTPVPNELPTNTPVPTLLPTPTPLPAGNSFVINDRDGNPWQLRVTEIRVVDSLQPTFSDSIERAAGRFVILFMEVTNRGLSPKTFVATGMLVVRDASGQRYESNTIAAFYAHSIYGGDICANINPDETKYCIIAYDISRQSDFYILGPGSLADSYAPRILLEIP